MSEWYASLCSWSTGLWVRAQIDGADDGEPMIEILAGPLFLRVPVEFAEELVERLQEALETAKARIG